MTKFVAFPKIARLSREMTVTEKIDGTNASVFIRMFGQNDFDRTLDTAVGDLIVRAGSRTRWISPADDNFGFAAWTNEHAQDLALLGVGHHFGEWWGKGIQRHYDLPDRRFSLFNVSRWALCGEPIAEDDERSPLPPCCGLVPMMYRAEFDTYQINGCLDTLRRFGSQAALGFMKPEGIIVYHTAGNKLFKKTCEHDDEPKGAHIKKEKVPRAPKNPATGGRRTGLVTDYVGDERRGK